MTEACALTTALLMEGQDTRTVRPSRNGGNIFTSFEALQKSGNRYGVIYADPPWSYRVYSGVDKQRSAERRYKTMTHADICALPVADFAAKESALLMWAVMPQLAEALEVVKAWGFEYKTVGFTWVKTYRDKPHTFFVGMGYYTRANPEICLLATRGAPKRQSKGVQQLIVAPRGAHSAKPELIADHIGRLFDGPYLELFARRPRHGWDVLGNEVDGGLFHAREANQ